MTTLFIAFRLLWKRKAANFALLLQVLISVVMLAQVYAFITEHYDNVRAVNELPVGNSSVLHTFDYYSPDRVAQHLSASPAVASIGNVHMGNVYYNNTDCNLAFYNKNIITHYSPELKAGIWLSDYVQDNHHIPAVISDNLGADVGSQISIRLPSRRQMTVMVVGILKQPTQYLFPSGSASPQFFSASSVIDNSPVVILREEDIDHFEVFREKNNLDLSRNLFIFLRPGYENAKIKEAMKDWNKYGEITPISSLVSTYTHNANIIIVGGLITFGVFFSLAITSVLSNNVIQSMKNRYIFTVYYLLGMSWKSIALTELVRTGILIVCMVVLSALAGQFGLLMLEWMTPARITAFYGIALLYIIMVFAIIGSVFLYKLMRNDISVSLKELQHGE